MVDLLDKHKTIAERHARMMTMGVNAVGLTNDKILSPTRAMINGRETILAGTNNYMGITFEPDCIAAGQKAMAEFGTGTTGSRIANGSYAMHRELEAELAKFLERKHCIVFTTGYQANLGMMAGLAGPKDTIFLDADSHSSIYDGCTLSGAKLVRFRHNDASDLDKRLARPRAKRAGGLWWSKASIRCWATARRLRISSRSSGSMAFSFLSMMRIPSACSAPMAAALAMRRGSRMT